MLAQLLKNRRGSLLSLATTALLLPVGAHAEGKTIAAAIAPVEAPLLSVSSFDDGILNLNQWTISGNAPTLTTEVSRKGKYALKSFLDRLKSEKSYRTELSLKGISAERGKDYWYGFSIYLPEDFVSDNIWEILAQWHGIPDEDLGESNENLNPPLSLQSTNGEWKLSSIWDSRQVTDKKNYEGKRSYKLGAYQRGAWTDWVFHIRWSPDSKGLLQVWQNGKKVVDTAGPIGFNDKRGPYFKLGIYKGWDDRYEPPGNVGVRTVYHDEIRVASGPDATYADVAPGGDSPAGTRRPLPPEGVAVESSLTANP